MRFVVLAAGIGSRLWPLTESVPKCLVMVGGKTILERLLEQAEATDQFSEAVVLTGYRARQVDEFAQQWNRTRLLPLRLVNNPAFGETNNSYSLYLARDLLAEGFVLADGDLVLDPAIVQRIAACERSSLVVDAERTLDPEAMKCTLNDQGLITTLSKEIPLHLAAAESIGLSLFDAQDAREVGRRLSSLVAEGELQQYYERALQDMLIDGWRPSLINVGGLGWEEVDDRTDLERAQSLVGRIDAGRPPRGPISERGLGPNPDSQLIES
jgi:L-glutamine-phosphate cytidylyltransferase